MSNKKFILFTLIALFIILPAISAEEIASEESGTLFNAGGSPVCFVSSGGQTFWDTGLNRISSENNCYNESGMSPQGNKQLTCCPSGQKCNNETGKCIPGTVITGTSCSDFKNPTDCGNPNIYGNNLPEAIKNLIENKFASDNPTKKDANGRNILFCHTPYIMQTPDKNGKCLFLGYCSCKWEGSATNGKCSEDFEINEACPTEPDVNEQFVHCVQTTKPLEKHCDSENEAERYMLISWTAKLVDQNGIAVTGANALTNVNCKNGSKRYPCPPEATPSENLPFFGIANLFISFIAVCLVYLFLRKK